MSILRGCPPPLLLSRMGSRILLRSALFVVFCVLCFLFVVLCVLVFFVLFSKLRCHYFFIPLFSCLIWGATFFSDLFDLFVFFFVCLVFVCCFVCVVFVCCFISLSVFFFDPPLLLSCMGSRFLLGLTPSLLLSLFWSCVFWRCFCLLLV